jgi:hypothetical protein
MSLKLFDVPEIREIDTDIKKMGLKNETIKFLLDKIQFLNF